MSLLFGYLMAIVSESYFVALRSSGNQFFSTEVHIV